MSTVTETNETVKKATKKSAKPAKKVAKKTTKKVAKKATKKAAKSSATDGLTMKERHALAAQRDIAWNESRTAVVKALKVMKAFTPMAAKTATEIADRSGVDIKKVKIHCDVYRGNELAYPTRDIVRGIRHEGSRELSYYLGAAGKAVKL